MKIGIFADVHDHLDNLRKAVERFNSENVELVLFAGDLVSTFAVPPLRKLKMPFVGTFGDNEGNKIGLLAGMQDRRAVRRAAAAAQNRRRHAICHRAHEKPIAHRARADYDVAIIGHTHKPRIAKTTPAGCSSTPAKPAAGPSAAQRLRSTIRPNARRRSRSCSRATPDGSNPSLYRPRLAPLDLPLPRRERVGVRVLRNKTTNQLIRSARFCPDYFAHSRGNWCSARAQ